MGLEGGVRRVCKISVARYLVAHRFEWCLTQRKLLRRERKSEQSIADTANISLGFCHVSNVYMYSSVDYFFFNIKKLYCHFKMFFVAFCGGGGGKGKLPCQREGFVGARGAVAGSSGPFAGLS